jgi:hypothetical protein
MGGSTTSSRDSIATINSEIIEQATKVLTLIARGKFSCEYKPIGPHDANLGTVINLITRNLKSVVQHVNLIAQGRYDVDFLPANQDDELGLAISDMTEMLREMSQENKKSAWIKSGQAELSNIIRGDQDSSELGKNVLSFLARYINALVGNIYQVSLSSENTLELIGSFAAQKYDKQRKRIRYGEGLVGQCVLEKEQLVFSDLPPSYLTIGSSLGQSSPRHIIVTPFLIEREIVGVMELGMLDSIDQTKLELLRQVSENIAIALKSSQNSERLKNLLSEKRRQPSSVREIL